MSLVRAIRGASSILLAIPLSAFSDSFDRKRAALLSLAFTVIPHFTYTFSTRWEQLIPFKMMANIDWGLYTPAEVLMIADITVSSKRVGSTAWPELPTLSEASEEPSSVLLCWASSTNSMGKQAFLCSGPYSTALNPNTYVAKGLDEEGKTHRKSEVEYPKGMKLVKAILQNIHSGRIL